VPSSTLNLGAYYKFRPGDRVDVQPVASFQFVGTQALFDNSIGAPSSQTMPSYGKLNLGVTVPLRHFDVVFNALNVLNKQYNEYEYISVGSYFGTGGNVPPEFASGYKLAYPAAPFTAYGGVDIHF